MSCMHLPGWCVTDQRKLWRKLAGDVSAMLDAHVCRLTVTESAGTYGFEILLKGMVEETERNPDIWRPLSTGKGGLHDEPLRGGRSREHSGGIGISPSSTAAVRTCTQARSEGVKWY